MLRLLKQRDGDEVYDLLLDAEKDWFINSHLVNGVPTLVGSTFIELLCQLAETRGIPGFPTIENLYFLSPLMFAPGSASRIRLFATTRNGTHTFNVKSQPAALDEESGPWQGHVMGELRPSTASAGGQSSPAASLPDLRARFPQELTDGLPGWDKIFVEGRTLLEFGERWRMEQKIFSGAPGEWLVRLKLNEKFAADLQDHRFHPALVDVALAAAVGRVARDSYLPLGYRRVHCRAPLSRREVYSHIRLKGNFRPGAETITFDVSVRDGDGPELLAVERYTLKRVTAAKLSARPTPGSAGSM